MLLCPKNYVAPVEVEKPARDTSAAVAAIKAAVTTKPRDYAEVIAEVKAVEKAAGRYYTNSELHALVVQVDEEWHPAPKEVEPDGPIGPSPKEVTL